MNADEIKKEGDAVASKSGGKLPSSFWRWLIGVGVLLVVVLVPAPKRSSPGYRAEAVLNAGQIARMLFSFEQQYKSYPNDKTGKSISLAKDLGGDLGRSGSSNYYFRQLIVTGQLDQERPFDLESDHGEMADNLMEGSKLLESGECAYSYVVWESTENLHDNAPIVMTPLVPGKCQFDDKFAREHYNGRVVVARRDTSVKFYILDSSGRVTIDGKDFFDPSQPYWGGQKPRIAWPE